MIYQNSRPLTRNTNRTTLKRRFEWRDFMEQPEESAELIQERFTLENDEDRIDEYFLLPGRANQITRLSNEETFEIKTLVDQEGPLELWETTVKSEVPLRRTVARMIAARIPKFSGPVVGAMSPQELSESLSKKTRFYRVKARRQIFKRGDVKARISRARIGETHTVSIAFESPRAEPLMQELKALGLRKRTNTNYGAFLLEQA